jgi:hypothetical protein
VTSFDRELVGDEEAVPLSSSIGVPSVGTERLSGWTKVVDECIRFVDVNKLDDDDDIRESLRIDNGEGSIDFKFAIEDDCFGIAFWSTCSRFLPAAVVLYLR